LFPITNIESIKKKREKIQGRTNGFEEKTNCISTEMKEKNR
jgi:hypothetical protein